MLYARLLGCRCKSKKSCTFFDRDFQWVLSAEPVQLVQFAGDCCRPLMVTLPVYAIIPPQLWVAKKSKLSLLRSRTLTDFVKPFI